MVGVATVVLLAAAGLALLGLGGFAVVSLREGERRAARVAVALALGTSLPLCAGAAAPVPVRIAAAGVVCAAVLAAIALWFAPVGRRVTPGGRPSRRVDERDIMFARGRLRPDTPEYESYYAMRPENRAGDDRTRALPGLLSLDAERADPVSFAAAEASFALTEALRHAIDGEVATERVERPAHDWTAELKRLARSWGAVEAGVTEVRPSHVYTHVGRGTGTWGEEVELDHRWAIAFTVEMDHRAMAHAPDGPVIAESARQYVEAAKIAIQLATFIRSVGYPARAHIDGNYRVIAPLVARDSGLGEVGRMGLVMTPRLGPRVRLGVVTTDMPLTPDTPGDDPTALDFCTVCKKCAENCPVAAIPSGERTAIDDGLRWAIDPETCYRYWNAIGTDCGTCMRVCPYSHPDSMAHNLVRWAIARSGGMRRLLLWMDDLFYGRRPQPRRAAGQT